MSEIKHPSFNENEYKAMKTHLQTCVSDWEEECKKSSEETKKKHKLETEIYKYTQSIKFLSWYLIEEYKLKDKIIYSSKEKQWYSYIPEKYIWIKVETNLIETLVDELAQKPFPFIINGHLKNAKKRDLLICQQLEILLQKDLQTETNLNLIAFKNKVIDLSVMPRTEVKNITSKHLITQYNPNIWEDNANCDLIDEWIEKGLFPGCTEEELEEKKEVFYAICNIILQTNRKFLVHFFLEISGVSGSGKSLMQTLLESLVSQDLRTVSNLKILQKSNFETSSFKNKHLVVFPDHQGYIGEASIFKQITGGDPLRDEPKYGKKGTFIYHGVTIITSNNKLSLSTVETSILRRRILFRFTKAIPLTKIKKNLLYFNSQTGEVEGLWANQIPGIIQKALKMKDSYVKEILNGYLEKHKHITDANPLPSFIKLTVVPYAEGELSIRSHKISYPLYDVYKHFCVQEGLIPLSKQNFEDVLSQEFSSVYPGYEIKLTRRGDIGTVASGLMYVQLIDEQIYPAIVKAHRDTYGERSYYDLERNQDMYNLLTFKGLPEYKNIMNIVNNINLPDKLYRNIGLALSEKNKEPFDSIYTLNYFVDHGVKMYKDYAPFVENTTELQKFLVLVLRLNFAPDLSENSKITTQEIFNALREMLQKHKKRTNLQSNQIKSKVLETWAVAYPPSTYQQIREANNIGDYRQKGFMYIKRRPSPDQVS